MKTINDCLARLRRYAIAIEGDNAESALMLKAIACGLEEELNTNYAKRQRDMDGEPIYIGERMVTTVNGKAELFHVAAIGSNTVVDEWGNFHRTTDVSAHKGQTMVELLNELDRMWPDHFDAYSMAGRCHEIAMQMREILAGEGA